MRINPQTRQWLISVLPRYSYPDRVLEDFEEILLKHRGLNPKTDYYTSDSGERILLLNLFGVLTVNFQNAEYNIPVEFWVPLRYPLENPFCFVKPTAQMYVKAGKYVDLSGRVMHPYIHYWKQENKISVFADILQTEFSNDPPVLAKGPPLPAKITANQGPPPIPAKVSSVSPPPIPQKISGFQAAQTQYSTTNIQNIQKMDLPAPRDFGSPARYQTPTQSVANISESNQNSLLMSYNQPQPKPLEMPTLRSPINVIPDAALQQSIRNRADLLQKVTNRLKIFGDASGAETNRLTGISTQLKRNHDYLAQCSNQLNEIENILKNNCQSVETRIEELTVEIAKLRSKPDVDYEKDITGLTPLHDQLIEENAMVQAIDDTLANLSRGLGRNNSDYETSLRTIRQLARKSFLGRVLIKKIKSELE